MVKDHLNSVILGDCIDVMKKFPEHSIDTIITDPPYGLKFMGKKWDYDVPTVETFKEMLRVAKPGAMLLCFAGSRTFHRMAVNIEDAGWEIRDCIMWLYGSGFPKSMDISKAIDKRLGATRKVVGTMKTNTKMQGNNYGGGKEDTGDGVVELTEPASDKAKHWNGWGTALKPAYEPIILAMKPVDQSFVDNALRYGVSGLNIDESRVECTERPLRVTQPKETNSNVYSGRKDGSLKGGSKIDGTTDQGRFPANVILDEISADILDNQSGLRRSGGKVKGTEKSHTGQTGIYGNYQRVENFPFKDSGGASRFFYCAKASSKERNQGIEMRNHHPTVKPLKLMEYLCKLTKTPSGGVILDPFAGSGTMGLAAIKTQRNFILIEKEPEYADIINHRLNHQKKEAVQDGLFKQVKHS